MLLFFPLVMVFTIRFYLKISNFMESLYLFLSFLHFFFIDLFNFWHSSSNQGEWFFFGLFLGLIPAEVHAFKRVFVTFDTNFWGFILSVQCDKNSWNLEVNSGDFNVFKKCFFGYVTKVKVIWSFFKLAALFFQIIISPFVYFEK